MNMTSPARLVLAAAVLVDAVAVFWVSRGIYLEPMAAKPLITAAGLGLLVAAVAAAVVMKPTPRAISLARGVALILIVCMLGVAFTYNLAANFESGVGDKEMSTVVALLAAGTAVQVAIFVAARIVDGRTIGKALGPAINHAFLLWLIGRAFYFVLGFVVDAY